MIRIDMDRVQSNLSSRLNLLMEQNKLKRADLVDITGSGYTTVSNWIKGNSLPELKVILFFSEYFNVSVDWLLGNEQTQGVSISPLESEPETSFSPSNNFLQSYGNVDLENIRSAVAKCDVDTLKKGGSVLIDISKKDFSHDGLYALQIGPRVDIRKITINASSQYIISGEDSPRDTLNNIQIVGHVISYTNILLEK